MSNAMTALEREMRDAVEFVERLVILKSNRHYNLSSGTYEPIRRKAGEHFIDYCIRVRAAFPPGHKLPRKRLRKPV